MEDKHKDDRDLLISLREQMSYQKEASAAQGTLLIKIHDKMDHVISQLNDKADRKDVSELRDIISKKVDQGEHGDLRERVAVLERDHLVRDVKKDTVINVGKMTWKTWLGVSGFVIFIITMVNLIAQK